MFFLITFIKSPAKPVDFNELWRNRLHFKEICPFYQTVCICLQRNLTIQVNNFELHAADTWEPCIRLNKQPFQQSFLHVNIMHISFELHASQ